MNFAILPLALLLAATAGAQILVSDINATTPGASSGPDSFVTSGGVVYFVASDGLRGREVWWTDGVTASLAADIALGPASSNPTLGYPLAGGVIVIADDRVHGQEMFLVNQFGATLLEINPGPLGTPFGFGVVNDLFLCIAASTPQTGMELWATNGTSAHLVRDLMPGPADGVARFGGLAVVDDRFLFCGIDGRGTELWSTDGTAGFAMLVKDIAPGPTSGLGSGTGFVTDGRHAFFAGFEPASGVELWVTDGTLGGTTLVQDLVPGGTGSQPLPMGLHRGICYVRAQTPATGTELFTARPNQNVVTLLRDFTLGAGSTLFTDLRGAGDFVFFLTGSTPNTQLQRTDGTTAGTIVLRSGPPQAVTGDVRPVGASTRVLFAGVEPSLTGAEPWRSDGTAATTSRLFDLEPGATGSNPAGFVVAGSRVVFAATRSDVGRELFAMPLSLVHGAIIEVLLPGCPGTGGRIPVLGGVGAPAVGQSFTYTLARALPNSPAVLVIGNTRLPGSGCVPQLLLAVAINLTTSANGAANVPLQIPNNPLLRGAELFAQAAVLDPAGGFLGVLSLSNGLRVVIGDP